MNYFTIIMYVATVIFVIRILRMLYATFKLKFFLEISYYVFAHLVLNSLLIQFGHLILHTMPLDKLRVRCSNLHFC